MKNILPIILIFAFAGCVSKEKATQSQGASVDHQNVSVPTTPPARIIDYPSIQRLLQLDRRHDQLGYTEKIYNTCQVGFGYPDTDCQKKYFVVIHFKLVCRDSEGTISTVLTDDDLKPISGEKVSWYLKNANGSTVTDSEGYGQIIATTNESQKTQRLRLAVGSDFLFLKAGEVNRLIAPRSWCNH